LHKQIKNIMKRKLLNSLLVLINKNSTISFAIALMIPFTGLAQIQHDLLVDLDFENGITDSSSENQTTLISGASSYVTDKYGNTNACIQFNGTSNNGSVFLTNDVTGTYKMNFPASFSAWVNIASYGTLSSPILTTEDHGSAYSGFWVEVSTAGAVQAHFGNGFGTSASDKKTFETASGVINLNTWHHIAVVFKSANEAIIYVDGFAKPTTVSGGATSCYYYKIVGTAGKIGGYVKGTGNRSINGKVDKVKFFGAALTQSEVFALSYVKHNNMSSLLFNYNMDNNYYDTSIYQQTSAQVGTCQYGSDQLSYANAALNVTQNSAIEIREAAANFKCNFPMTFASWIKVDALGSINPIFTNDDNTSSYTGVWVQILANGTIGVNIGDGSGTSAFARRSYVTTNALGADFQWRHLTVVLKAAASPTLFTVEIYVNGVLWPVGAQSGTGTQLVYNTNTGNWGKLGCYNKGTSTLSTFSGGLDGCMFWNDSLTSDQINNIVDNYYTGCLTLPTIQANTSASAVCSGTAVTLNGGGGATYVWTGGVTNGVSFSPSATNTYTVTGTDVNNCSNSATVAVVVNDLPAITINASASTVCAGNSLSLTGNGAANYSWTGGITNGVTFIPTATATYTVTGTDINNCTNSNSISVTVNDLPTVTINSSASTVCAGSTVTLSGAGADTYTWNNGVIDGQEFLPVENYTYTVVGVDSNSCSATASTTIAIDPLPTIATTLNGSTISANETGATYQWLNCGNNGYTIISWETTQSYTATVVGSYAVLVTKNGCSDTSACVAISTVGIETNADTDNDIVMYPMPASNQLTINNKSTESCKIELMDATGKVVYSAVSSKDNTVVDIRSFSNGLYFARFTIANKVTTQKFVVSQ
jgi:hypothetical protein